MATTDTFMALRDRDVEGLRAAMSVASRIKRGNLCLYSLMYLTIDGSLQAEEQKVEVRIGPEKTRVYARWSVPEAGLEFDGRQYVGSDGTLDVGVIGAAGEYLVNRRMTCVWFAVGHSVDNCACARAIFECDTPKP
jgi:hypothetical protein